jgi:hypothetical protein
LAYRLYCPFINSKIVLKCYTFTKKISFCEKKVDSQLVMKFLAFYKAHRFFYRVLERKPSFGVSVIFSRHKLQNNIKMDAFLMCLSYDAVSVEAIVSMTG